MDGGPAAAAVRGRRARTTAQPAVAWEPTPARKAAMFFGISRRGRRQEDYWDAMGVRCAARYGRACGYDDGTPECQAARRATGRARSIWSGRGRCTGCAHRAGVELDGSAGATSRRCPVGVPRDFAVVRNASPRSLSRRSMWYRSGCRLISRPRMRQRRCLDEAAAGGGRIRAVTAVPCSSSGGDGPRCDGLGSGADPGCDPNFAPPGLRRTSRGARQDAGGGPCQHHPARAGGPMSASIGVYVATALFLAIGGDSEEDMKPDVWRQAGLCVKQCHWSDASPECSATGSAQSAVRGQPSAGDLLGQLLASRSVRGTRARRQHYGSSICSHPSGCRVPSRPRIARRSMDETEAMRGLTGTGAPAARADRRRRPGRPRCPRRR